MKFHHLIRSNNWLSVKDKLLDIFPEQAKNMEGYEDPYQGLLVMVPENTEMEIILEVHDDLLEEEPFVTVGGKKMGEKESDKISYALEFSPWAEWLGMEIAAETLEKYGELEIIAHCLFEMTFIGFDEETIQQESSKLQNEIDEWENMSDEEKKKNTFTLEDLMNKLYDKGK